MKSKNNIGMIEVVAKGLGSLKERAVFVGGATVVLYVTDGSTTVRPTDDVDCVVEITSRQDYYDFQAALEKSGFRHSKETEAPICRMDFLGLKVDIMLSDPRILGFSNKWYQEGMKAAVKKKLPNGDQVRIFSLPYFVAAKIEAFLGRGQRDFRLSWDFEDIVTVLAGQRDFKALSDSAEAVRAYLKKQFRGYVSDPVFMEAVSAHLDPGPNHKTHAEQLLDRINAFCVEG